MPTKKYKSYQRYHPRSHKMYGTSFYRRWQAMKIRCENTRHPAYHRYGGRGITHPWPTFNLFLKDMYGTYLEHVSLYGEKYTQLDRINNDLSYSRKNCRWVTPKQNSNNSSSVRLMTYKGKTHNLRDWAFLLGGSKNLVQERLRKGWDIERALSHKKSDPIKRSQ